jgi:hypothetical protein
MTFATNEWCSFLCLPGIHHLSVIHEKITIAPSDGIQWFCHFRLSKNEMWPWNENKNRLVWKVVPVHCTLLYVVKKERMQKKGIPDMFHSELEITSPHGRARCDNCLVHKTTVINSSAVCCWCPVENSEYDEHWMWYWLLTMHWPSYLRTSRRDRMW